MPSCPAENEFAEYYSPSGVAIACRVLYRTGQPAFVQFRTVDWAGYNGFANYVTTAVFIEHLRPADPSSPGVRRFVQALEKEAATQREHLANCRHYANDKTAPGSASSFVRQVLQKGGKAGRDVSTFCVVFG